MGANPGPETIHQVRNERANSAGQRQVQKRKFNRAFPKKGARRRKAFSVWIIKDLVKDIRERKKKALCFKVLTRKGKRFLQMNRRITVGSGMIGLVSISRKVWGAGVLCNTE